MQYGTGSPEARWRTQGRDVFLGIVSSSSEPSKPLRVVSLSINCLTIKITIGVIDMSI